MLVFPAPNSVRSRWWQGYVLLPFPTDSWVQTKERVIDSPWILAQFQHSNNNVFALWSWAPLTIRIFLFPFIQQTFTPMDAVSAKDKVGIPGSLHSRHTEPPWAGSRVWKPCCSFTIIRHGLKAKHWVCYHKLQQKSPLISTLAPAHQTFSSPRSLRLFWLSLFTVCYKVKHYLNTAVTGRYPSHAGPHGNIWAEPWQGCWLKPLLTFKVIS